MWQKNACTHIHNLVSEIPITVGAGLGQSQSLKLHPGLPYGWQESRYLCYRLLPIMHIRRDLDQKGRVTGCWTQNSDKGLQAWVYSVLPHLPLDILLLSEWNKILYYFISLFLLCDILVTKMWAITMCLGGASSHASPHPQYCHSVIPSSSVTHWEQRQGLWSCSGRIAFSQEV